MVDHFPLGNPELCQTLLHLHTLEKTLLWQTCFWQEHSSRPEHYTEVRRLLDFSVVAESPSACLILWHVVDRKSTSSTWLTAESLLF